MCTIALSASQKTIVNTKIIASQKTIANLKIIVSQYGVSAANVLFVVDA